MFMFENYSDKKSDDIGIFKFSTRAKCNRNFSSLFFLSVRVEMAEHRLDTHRLV